MKEYTYECDRCGKICTRVAIPHVTATIPHITISEECGSDYWQSVLFDCDLCGDCLRELKQFMHAYDEKKEAVPA